MFWNQQDEVQSIENLIRKVEDTNQYHSWTILTKCSWVWIWINSMKHWVSAKHESTVDCCYKKKIDVTPFLIHHSITQTIITNPLKLINSASKKPGENLEGLSRSTTSTLRRQEVWKDVRIEQQEPQRFCKHDQRQMEWDGFFGKEKERAVGGHNSFPSQEILQWYILLIRATM